ncbi:hypothetical protein CL622_00630 [archaeon]|nr:hypothetical protein [archaeon]
MQKIEKPKKETDAVSEAIKQQNSGKLDKDVAKFLGGEGMSNTAVDSGIAQANLSNKGAKDPLDMGSVFDEKNEAVGQQAANPMEFEGAPTFKGMPDGVEPVPGVPGNLDMQAPGVPEAPSPQADAPVQKGPEAVNVTTEPSMAAPDQNEVPVMTQGRSGQSVEPMLQSTQPVQEPAVSTIGSQETIHQIAEKVVYEKWDELMGDVGDFSLWKQSIEREIKSVKQEVLRVNARVEGVQASVMGKVKEYGDSVSSLGTEMKVLENVLQKIIEPLTNNIKTLSKITEKLDRSVK